jgi:transcriptional regulator with PAS, ATPase and Fis domain
MITADTLTKYLPQQNLSDLPVLYRRDGENKEISERDLLYKVLFDMKKDIHDLKQVVGRILRNEEVSDDTQTQTNQMIKKLYDNIEAAGKPVTEDVHIHHFTEDHDEEPIQESEVVEESLSIQDKEIDLIKKALARHHGRRKNAARELGISERTLYRKIKEYDIN